MTCRAPGTRRARLSAAGAVCALGRRHGDLAESYSKICGRQAIIVPNVAALWRVRRPSVLIASWQQLVLADFDSLYRLSVDRGTVGLIVAQSHEQLRRRAALCARLVGKFRSCRQLLPAQAIIGMPIPRGDLGVLDRVADENATAETVREILRGPSSILGFIGHSDGIDSRLSLNATLCARKDHRELDTATPQANCDITEYCHRLRMPRDAALSSARLVGTEAIAANALLMLSCYVARPVDSSTHPATGLLAKILRNSQIGSVIAPWEPTYPTCDDLATLAECLLQGKTMGEALGEYYRSSAGAQRGCNRYLLFGDPDHHPVVRPRPPRPGLLTDTVAAPQRLRAVPLPGTTPIVGWLRSRLDKLAINLLKTKGTENSTERSVLREGQAALSALARADFTVDSFAMAMRGVLALRSDSHSHWIEEAPARPEYVKNPATSCLSCEQPGRLYRVETRFGARWLANCARCGIFYASVPADSSLLGARFLVLNDLGVHLGFALPETTAVLICLRSSTGDLSIWRLHDPPPLPHIPSGKSWLWVHVLGPSGYFAFSQLLHNAYPPPNQSETSRPDVQPLFKKS